MVESLNQAAQIARDAKALLQSLRECLKTRDPWDREVEFQRQNLRRHYLQLLLAYPYAPQSQAADNPLWIETSHAFINVYRQRITSFDRTLTNAFPADSTKPPRATHGPVEFRRLVQRFRQFLAEEEKFWAAFIIRFVRSFALDEAKPALVALGIAPNESSLSDQHNGRPRNEHPRNQFPEEGNPTPPPPGQREKKLLVLTKAFVSLGDLARYREQYNEAGGRPRAGKETHDDGSPRKGGRGGRRAADVAPTRPRNYSKASDCYQQARLLFPEAGNASHQLAILASYTGDSFGSVLHYYRSLCVRQPFPTAMENLEKTLARSLEGHRTLKAKAGEGMQSPQSPRGRVEKCKREVILLHALWRLDPVERDELAPDQAISVIEQFRTLVNERIMPADIISKILVLAISALWNIRMSRDPHPRRSSGGGPSESRKTSNATEALILAHILDLLRILAQIGIEQQLAESDNASSDLSQNITAVFRRTLPSLRIATKWLKSNLDYITRAAPSSSPAFSKAVLEFWKSYAEFANVITQAFPLDKLPSMAVPLEEDVEMSGFAPLKRSMFEHSTKTSNGLLPGQSQVHPNEEQLMRLSDLLGDAKFIAESETSPLRIGDGRFIALVAQQITSPPTILSRPPDPSSSRPSSTAFPSQQISIQNDLDRHLALDDDLDDDSATVSTRTEDDPVNLAMRATLDRSDEDELEDEQILYPQHTPPKPVGPAADTSSFSTPAVIQGSQAPHVSPTGTTAQDLLLRVLGSQQSPLRVSADQSRATYTKSSAPQSHLLFGSGSSASPSIWSPSREGFPSSLDSRTYLQNQQASPGASSPTAWGNNFSNYPTHSQTTSLPGLPLLPHLPNSSPTPLDYPPQLLGSYPPAQLHHAHVPAFATPQFSSASSLQPHMDSRQYGAALLHDGRVRSEFTGFTGPVPARPWS